MAWLLAGLGLVLVGLVLSLPALYLVDLPAWVYQGALFRAETADASATPWSLVTHPVPNTLATLLPAMLLSVVGPIWTGKILATGLLAAGFGAAWALARAVSPDDASSTWARAAVLVACVVVSSSFWNGYVGYQIGVVLAMALGALWLCRGHLSAPAILIGSVVLFFAHAIPFALVVLAIGIGALRRRDFRQLAALVPAAALVAWYITARIRLPGGGFMPSYRTGSMVDWLIYRIYTVLKMGPFQHPAGVHDAGALASLPSVFWLVVSISGLFTAALVLGLIVGTRAMPPGPLRTSVWGVWTIAGVSMMMPPFILSVVNPGERILVLALVALIAIVPLNRRLLRVLGFVALIFLLDDARSLWAQRSGLSDADRVAFYADRAEREQNPTAYTFEDAVEDAVASPTPLLSHPILLHSDMYDAVSRHDWTRHSFSTGLLRPTDRPRASP